MGFDLTDLNLFLHVAEAGSITAGADRAHLALASASARIRGMEDTLGAPLLVRGRRGVEPTEAGRIVVRHARAVLGQLERLRGELEGSAKGPRGVIRLLCASAALTGCLPDALSAFLTGHPRIDIDIAERQDRDIPAAIAQGKADMGILEAGVNPGELETIPFHHYRLALATAPGHPLTGLKNPTLSDALDYDLLGLATDNALEESLAGHAAKMGRVLKLRARLGNREAICRMVERNAGVGLMPEEEALRCQKSMDIRVIGLKEEWAARRLVLCVRKREQLSGYARELLETLGE